MAELRVEGDELVLHLTPLEEVEGLHGELRVRVTLDGSAHDAWVVGCADPEQVAAEISHRPRRNSALTAGAVTTHSYELSTRWTGNLGAGTASYATYARDYEISAVGKPALAGSSDPHFRGDPARYNPEELLVASLSACHMLWYLHLCADAGVVVESYEDLASGSMAVGPDGGGAFSEVVLRPRVTVANDEMVDVAMSTHVRAHELCFVANSVNFPVRHEPAVSVRPA